MTAYLLEAFQAGPGWPGLGWARARLGSRGVMGRTSPGPLSAEKSVSNEKKMTRVIPPGSQEADGEAGDGAGVMLILLQDQGAVVGALTVPAANPAPPDPHLTGWMTKDPM